jgi:hypothetical protein
MAADIAKQSVLYFVPFACAGREMRHVNFQIALIHEFLQLKFEQSVSGAIAASSIAGDVKP